VHLHQIQFDKANLGDFCRRHGVATLALFGSIFTDRFSEASDIDVLVEFLPDRRVSLFYLGGMLMELSEVFGRKVDLRTPGDLSPHFRDDVLREARLLYAA
jgi:predicted nucleotidyltransferase